MLQKVHGWNEAQGPFSQSLHGKNVDLMLGFGPGLLSQPCCALWGVGLCCFRPWAGLVIVSSTSFHSLGFKNSCYCLPPVDPGFLKDIITFTNSQMLKCLWACCVVRVHYQLFFFHQWYKINTVDYHLKELMLLYKYIDTTTLTHITPQNIDTHHTTIHWHTSQCGTVLYQL